MKKLRILSLLLLFTLTSFTIHKFYIAIYQINYISEKKRLEITSRIFADDLNAALLKNYKIKTHIGESTETQEDITMMNQYLTEHFKIKVNGNPKNIQFISKEMENNVVIAYYKIVEISSIKTLSIQNTSLMEVFSDQQNIIQTNFNGKKQSLLLTLENPNGVLK
jgi:hypothetical protein